jgi:hypothetical protein
MVSPTQIVGSRFGPSDVKEIVLDYDLATGAVTVTPDTVEKGTTICFKGREGKVKVRAVFLSPFGDDTVEMHDSQNRTLTVGGIYHFRCFFTEPGGKEIALTGGILDVPPNRP